MIDLDRDLLLHQFMNFFAFFLLVNICHVSTKNFDLGCFSFVSMRLTNLKMFIFYLFIVAVVVDLKGVTPFLLLIVLILSK